MTQHLGTADRARVAAREKAPGLGPNDIRLARLRVPPAMREALGKALQIRMDGGLPAVHNPAYAISAELERDIALLADIAVHEASSRTMAALLHHLADAARALADAYATRMEGQPR